MHLPVLAGLLILTAVASCAPGPFAQGLAPELGGLPADTPPRREQPLAYPAVHDVPARDSKLLTPDQQARAESELNAVRQRQLRLQDPDSARKAELSAQKADAARKKAQDAANKGVSNAGER